jgi:hypothetical protein
MVQLVKHMLELHKELGAATMPADRELYQRQIEATDQQIDALVYGLYGLVHGFYGLTEGEMGMVEGWNR